MSPDLLTVKLEKLTYGGDALGHLSDGRAVFVPFGLPGETVSLRILEEKRGHVRAELVEVLEASPERSVPVCKHYGTCGGCHYQHMAYPAQLSAKTGILRDQLIRIGKIENPPMEAMIPCPREFNYRNHVQFHLTAEGRPGYVDVTGRNVLPVTECHLPEPALNEVWPRLEFEPGLGLERVALRLGEDDSILLTLESEQADMPGLELEADLSVVHLSGGDPVVMAGENHLVMPVNGRRFHISAGSFFQVNTAMAGKMVNHLLECLPAGAGSTLLDVYCGVGLFSAFFAGRVGRLVGIEAAPSACGDFAINLDEYNNVELYEAAAEETLPVLTVQSCTAIVDPPRAGLEKRALDALVALEPTHIAYVSCDPSTLARDAARLIAAGYHLTRVTPFDLFPQTYHIESISLFEKG